VVEEPENIVLVYLRRIDLNVKDLQRGQSEIMNRLNRLEEGVARVRRDQANDAETVAHLQAQVDRLREQIDRINRRLELVD
jgi:predicted  nucleic acid-binding Zn-ribbon protein